MNPYTYITLFGLYNGLPDTGIQADMIMMNAPRPMPQIPGAISWRGPWKHGDFYVAIPIRTASECEHVEQVFSYDAWFCYPATEQEIWRWATLYYAGKFSHQISISPEHTKFERVLQSWNMHQKEYLTVEQAAQHALVGPIFTRLLSFL